jgi:hypothetical protein
MIPLIAFVYFAIGLWVALYDTIGVLKMKSMRVSEILSEWVFIIPFWPICILDLEIPQIKK